METRRGQPGRYRVTGQKVEIAEMLPPPESLQPVQPRNRTRNRQVFETLSDCTAGCTVASVPDPKPDERYPLDGDIFSHMKNPDRYGLQPERKVG